MNTGELIEYAKKVYGAEPEYLWEHTPESFVLRHRENRKWFAVIMDVPRGRLGLPGEGVVRVADLKCGPLLGGSYTGRPGVVPAWHMNKVHWIGVLLDGGAEDETVKELLDISYALTAGKQGGRNQ